MFSASHASCSTCPDAGGIPGVRCLVQGGHPQVVPFGYPADQVGDQVRAQFAASITGDATWPATQIRSSPGRIGWTGPACPVAVS